MDLALRAAACIVAAAMLLIGAVLARHALMWAFGRRDQGPVGKDHSVTYPTRKPRP